LREAEFPLAPLAEQRRIVARVDALFAEVAEGEAALAAARKGLDVFRRALLKAAVAGELTKDWRAANPVSETGHDLLARIAKARAAKGRGRRNVDTPPLDTADLPELPEGWAWAKVGDLLEFVTSGSRGWKEYYADDGAIFVRAQNINSGVLDLSDVAFVRLPSNAEGLRTRLKVHDVLVTITGANVTVSARVTQDVPEAYINQHVALLRPVLPETSEWILLWLQAYGAGKSQLVEAAYGAGKPGLNLDNIREVSIAFPPLAEASEILRRVSHALSASADTLAMLDAEAADAARLKQSILKAAFEGRLVPQDPLDEPAAALLARLVANAPAVRASRGQARKSDA
jgi:type I restriction enzyme, S subunit